jgi:hypothetical protein
MDQYYTDDQKSTYPCVRDYFKQVSRTHFDGKGEHTSEHFSICLESALLMSVYDVFTPDELSIIRKATYYAPANGHTSYAAPAASPPAPATPTASTAGAGGGGAATGTATLWVGDLEPSIDAVERPSFGKNQMANLICHFVEYYKMDKPALFRALAV